MKNNIKEELLKLKVSKSKILVLDCNRDNIEGLMIKRPFAIENFISLSNSRRINDSLEILEAYCKDVGCYTIIAATNGLGIALRDYFENTGIKILSEKPTEIIKNIEREYIKNKDNFVFDLGTEIVTSNLNKLFGKRLITQLENIEPKVSGKGYIKLKRNDDSINKSMAMCYLMAKHYLSN